MGFPTGSSATLANVASSATSVTLFAANVNAQARTIFNDSSAILYVKFSQDLSAASSTSFVVQIAAGGYYEFPQPLYDGAVTGIWASANGNARTSETT